MSGYLVVFLVSALELWAGIPAGFAMKTHPIKIFLLSACGASTGSFIILFIGEKIRAFILGKHKGSHETKNEGKIMKIWKRYGVAGLGLLSPWITGAPIGIVIGLSLGAKKGVLFIWTIAGIIICASVLTGTTALGVDFFHSILKSLKR